MPRPTQAPLDPFVYVTSDTNKTHVDILTLAPHTAITIGNVSRSHPERTLSTVLPSAWPPPAAFVYVTGDATKTPVDLSAQQPGTALKYVVGTSEMDVVAGVFVPKPAFTLAALVQQLRQGASDTTGGKPDDPNSF